jgi:hypothetical protein
MKFFASLAIALLEILINFLPDRREQFDEEFYDHYR